MIWAFRLFLRVLCVLAAVLLPGEAAFATGAPSPAYGGADYRLGTADKIRVIVYGETDLGGEFQIDATGEVRLPLIGQIKAGGLTAHDLETSIAAALADGYLNDPRVAVEVLTYRPFYVVGEVLKPGEYPYAVGLTTASAVALAGGFSPKAVQSTVFIRHQGDSREQRVAVTDATPIHPGDVLRVDSTTFWDVIDVLSPLAGVSALRYTLP
jgi:polysaccharide export outer membrane protein